MDPGAPQLLWIVVVGGMRMVWGSWIMLWLPMMRFGPDAPGDLVVTRSHCDSTYSRATAPLDT
jgi:hypothetical protein